MFLKNIKINNYKSIQKASVDFENGMNILIGKNGVGKSNLLNFIADNLNTYISSFIQTSHIKTPIVDFEITIANNNENPAKELTFKLKREKVIQNQELAYKNTISLNKSTEGNLQAEPKEYIFNSNDSIKTEIIKEFRAEFNEFKNISKIQITYKLPERIFWLDNPTKFEIDSELNYINNNHWRGFRFLFTYEDLLEVSLMTKLNQSEFIISGEKIKEIIFEEFIRLKTLSNITECLEKYSPISDLRINSQNINISLVGERWLIDNLFLEFKVKDSWVPWNYLSDGTKRLFYIISECLVLIDGGIILLEEPELGIHPHQLFSLMNFLKEQSETKQIIISTHSPIVLDVLSTEELDKITIVKLSDKGTEFHKLNSVQIEKAQQYIQEVGELSYYWLHSDLEDE